MSVKCEKSCLPAGFLVSCSIVNPCTKGFADAERYCTKFECVFHIEKMIHNILYGNIHKNTINLTYLRSNNAYRCTPICIVSTDGSLRSILRDNTYTIIGTSFWQNLLAPGLIHACLSAFSPVDNDVHLRSCEL